LVGLNKYKSKEDIVEETQSINESAVKQQLERLCKLKKTRNTDKVQKSLQALKEVASGDGNIMPNMIHAVKTQATLGEISDTLREVFGEY